MGGRKALTAGLTIVAVLTASCGGGQPSSGGVTSGGSTATTQSTGTTPTTTPPDSATTTPTTAAPATSTTRPVATTTTAAEAVTPTHTYSTEPIEFEDLDGWSYIYTLELEEPVGLTLDKEIQYSPPGQARLHMQLHVPRYNEQVTPNTPGRTPPARTMRLFMVKYPTQVPPGHHPSLEASISGKPGNPPCLFAWEDNTYELRCLDGNPADFPGTASGWFEDTDEALVDTIISDPVLNGAPDLYFELSQGPGYLQNCQIQFSPDGTVELSPTLANGECR